MSNTISNLRTSTQNLPIIHETTYVDIVGRFNKLSSPSNTMKLILGGGAAKDIIKNSIIEKFNNNEDNQALVLELVTRLIRANAY